MFITLYRPIYTTFNYLYLPTPNQEQNALSTEDVDGNGGGKIRPSRL